MNFKGLRVLVLDGYGRQIPGILKQLHDLECCITTISCSKLDPGYASKYPTVRLLSSGFKENLDEMEKVIDRELCSGKYDVVIPVLEPSTNFITKNSEKYSKNVKIAAAPYKAFIKAYDKEETLKVCQQVGVPCPLTRMEDESVDDYLIKAKYPLALKPRKGTGSMGFRRVNTKDELLDLIKNGTVNPDEYVIQEYIPQNDIQYVTYMFIGADGETKSAMTAAKLRWFPIDGGSMCLGEAVDRPDLIKYSEKLLKGIGWRGFCQVGYINDPRDNVPKILEINGRIPASVKICYLCGCNIMKQMIEDSYNEPVTKYKTDIHGGIRLRYAQTDFLWFLKSRNRFSSKPSWFDRMNTKDYIFGWDDPWPYFAYSLKGVLRYKKDMEKRKR